MSKPNRKPVDIWRGMLPNVRDCHSFYAWVVMKDGSTACHMFGSEKGFRAVASNTAKMLEEMKEAEKALKPN